MTKNENAGCALCPRRCGADRARGEKGFCGAADTIRVARAALHAWEEPCLSGTRGSGTVFFSGCPLKCVYCQNGAISRGEAGVCISPARLVDIFFELAQQGAHNINLVTPTHYAADIARAIREARARGLTLPFVYNCGGYESVEALHGLDGLVDVYLPDFKYMDPALAKRYSNAEDYPAAARAALAEMVRQTGPARFDADGMMTRGVLVRHLVLPGCSDDSRAVLAYLYQTYGNTVYISIMRQYTPYGDLTDCPELNRTVTKREYERIVGYALSIGIENGFTQEGGAVGESFIPPFDLTGVLPREADDQPAKEVNRT